MKKLFNTIKNHNKIYSLLIFWMLWIIFVTGSFCGTNLALITFAIGFSITCLFIAYVTEKPNKKELKTLNKIIKIMYD